MIKGSSNTPGNGGSKGIHPKRLRVLPVAMVLFVIVILSKAASLVSIAVAQVPPSLSASKATASVAQLKGEWNYEPPPVIVCKPNPVASAGNMKILLGLHQRHLALERYAATLNRKQALVTAAEHALAKQLAALKIIETRLRVVQAKRDVQDNARWHNLVATYEAMQPRDAARIFDQLDNQLVMNILQRMSSRKTAAILAAMTPDKARSATEKLAGAPVNNEDNAVGPTSAQASTP